MGTNSRRSELGDQLNHATAERYTTYSGPPASKEHRPRTLGGMICSAHRLIEFHVEARVADDHHLSPS